jgi:Na+/H+ antiporter NhaA
MRQDGWPRRLHGGALDGFDRVVIGKPLGMLLFSALAVRLGIASKPPEYTWFSRAT